MFSRYASGQPFWVPDIDETLIGTRLDVLIDFEYNDKDTGEEKNVL